MRTHPCFRLTVSLLLMLLYCFTPGLQEGHATADDAWWDDDWPYRIPLQTNTPGIVAVNPNFSQAFDQLGLQDALLDLRSLRVVPYSDGIPGSPIPYQETYSHLIIDADHLEIDPLNPNWLPEESTKLSLDEDRHTQGSGSIKAHIKITETSLSETGFSYHFIDSLFGDWSEYEILLYDVWPEVNSSAIDQTPDLYFFSLNGISGCPFPEIKGPGLAMNTWNAVSQSLKPYGNCVSPGLIDLNSFRFFLQTNTVLDQHGFDPGDEVHLWLDNFRLVDQDGDGKIIWKAEKNVDLYYLYFDTLNHEGHPQPDLTLFSEPPTTITIDEPQAGGYFHQITGVSDNTISIWYAPPTEKILQSYQMPITHQPLVIRAARNEFEPIQLVINTPNDQILPVSIGPLIHTNGKTKILATQFDLFRVDYIDIERLSDQYGRLGSWPDPLYPIDNHSNVSFTANQNQPLWFRINVPSSAVPGFYHGEIHIGKTEVPITLQVWDFEIPQSPLLSSQFGFDWDLVLETYHSSSSPCQQDLIDAINQTFQDYHLTSTESQADLPDQTYTLSNYEIQTAQEDQKNLGTQAWWEFSPYDTPPFANPGVIDRPGVDARLLPWLAWLNRVDGLYYPQTTAWEDDPWNNLMDEYNSNGNGFLFYPPKDETLGFDPCEEASNRLIPSIRLELLREGMEDYAYLWLLNNALPQILTENLGDLMAQEFIQSDTHFSREPTIFNKTRSEIAWILENRIFLPMVLH